MDILDRSEQPQGLQLHERILRRSGGDGVSGGAVSQLCLQLLQGSTRNTVYI